MRRFNIVTGTAIMLTCMAALPAHATDGEWRIADQHANAQLKDVTAISDSDAWAVGSEVTAGRNHAVVRHWDGVSWNAVDLPASVEGIYLVHVAATSDDDLWITGTDAQDTAYTLHWDGTSWQVSSRNTFEPVGDSIALLGRDDVWILGEGADDLAAGSARHYDGTSWTTVSVPGWVKDVSFVSGQDIWATGLVSGPTQYEGAVMHWDGHGWATVLTRPMDSLNSVVALGAADVWVTGQAPNTGLALHWDGSGWTAGTPVAGVRNVRKVISDGAQGLWAIADGTRLLRYAGGAWSAVPLPQATGTTTELASLALVPGSVSAWGVGTLDVSRQGDLIPTSDVILKYGSPAQP